MSNTVLLWVQDPEYSQKIVDHFDYSDDNIVIEVKGRDLFSSLRQFSEHHDGSMCELLVSVSPTEICPLLEFCFVLFGDNFKLVLL